MKKLLSLIIAIAIVITTFAGLSINFTVSALSDGYYTYTVSLGEATITDVNTSISGDITIPSTLGGYPVTSIGSSAFEGCSKLTSITIGNSVTSIGSFAFYNCSSLTAVYITDLAAWCKISFSHSAANPLYYANNLYLNGELVQELVIPDSVTSIGDYAFYNCDSLTSVTIPDSVTSIGDYAFESCSSLTSVTIGNGVTSIGFSAFRGYSSLTSIIAAEGNTTYYSQDNCLIETSTKKLILGCKNSTIPNDVTSIGSSAFYGCSSLTSVTIPNSVTSIGSSAFSGCSSLTSVTIPNSVTSIGSYAFYGCSSLTSVTIPNSVTSIGSSAFSGCSSLTSVTIGNSVTSIGSSAFSGCTSLETVNFNAVNCTSMGSSNSPVFYGCTKLTTINIGDKATKIPSYAFYNCSSLTSVTIPDSVTSIGDYAFYGCTALENVNYLGSKTEKSAITIGSNNTNLTGVTWNYNSCDVEHKFSNSCDTECNECDYVRTITHTFDNDCDTRCNVCSFTRTISHKYDNTCDTNCNVCSAVRTITHTYDNDCDTNCNVCNSVRKITHVYTNDADLYCNVCNKQRPYLTVTYNANGVSSTLSDSKILEYTSFTLPSMSSNTYKFLGWSTTQLGGVEYYGGSTYKVMENTVLYAKWGNHCSNCNDKGTITSQKYGNKECWNCEDGVVHGAAACFNCGSTNVIQGGTIGNTSWAVHCGSCGGVDIRPGKRCTICNGLGYKYEYGTFTENCSHCSGKGYKAIAQPDAQRPKLENKTDTTVTLVKYDDVEYSRDGVTWQDSNVFSGLIYGAKYSFYMRYKGTNVNPAGKISEVIYIYTVDRDGDIDGKEGVSDSDAIYLLYHTFLPDSKPVNQICDFNGDGETNDKDAIYLLYHTFLPESYPIY